MKQLFFAIVFTLATIPAYAHFGAIIPSDDIITKEDKKELSLELKFLHPLEGLYMDMDKPKQFGVFHNGKKTDLLNTLQPTIYQTKGGQKKDKAAYWSTKFQIKRPGDYTFFMEPTPYWEPAEDLYIVHYTKVCVNALGLEEGWDSPVGLETEIVPFTRPYGLWVNNLFSGQVLLNGKPAPYAEIEIEYLNDSAHDGSTILPPAEPYITQVIKADGNGIFHYSMPKEGWWGFSALNEAKQTIIRDGEKKHIEIGAVYWIHATNLK